MKKIVGLAIMFGSVVVLSGCFSNDRTTSTPENIGISTNTSELALNDLLNAGVNDTNDALDLSDDQRAVNNTGDAFDL
jgi:hypothetical protein